jgi:hypothetical protein
LRQNDANVDVMHGPWVETCDTAFFEGTWAGKFREMGFVESPECFGTGARLSARSVEFAGTTAPFRALVSVRCGNELLISNSLCFILTQLQDAPDITYAGYYADLFKIFTAGFSSEGGTLQTARGRSIRFHLFSTLVVEKDLSLLCRRKPVPPPPECYEGYREYLGAALLRVRENAVDSARLKPFHPVTTISRGYDSVACSALGAAAGWKDTVTFVGNSVGTNPRMNNVDDDGASVAAHLGLSTRRYERSAWSTLAGMPEAEFAAIFKTGGMVPFAIMEEQLRGTVLLSGSLGDSTWGASSKHGPGVTPDMGRPFLRDMGAESLWEFQLRVGISMVYPCVLGATHRDAFKRIALSKELAPWSIGGTYDRPLCRRIAEDAGVPRELFGMRKMATAHTNISREFSPSFARCFRAFLVNDVRNALASRTGDPAAALLLKPPPANMQERRRWLDTACDYLFHCGTIQTMKRYQTDKKVDPGLPALG